MNPTARKKNALFIACNSGQDCAKILSELENHYNVTVVSSEEEARNKLQDANRPNSLVIAEGGYKKEGATTLNSLNASDDIPPFTQQFLLSVMAQDSITTIDDPIKVIDIQEKNPSQVVAEMQPKHYRTPTNNKSQIGG